MSTCTSGRMSSLEGRGGGQSVSITHIDSAGPFLKVFVVKDEIKKRLLNFCLNSISKDLDRGAAAPPCGSHFKKGDMVIVKCGSDWFRGTIEGMEKINAYFVHLFDVGKYETVEAQHIRWLEHAVQNGPVVSFPPLCTELLMAGLVSIGNAWEPFEIEYARNLLVGSQAIHVTDFETHSGLSYSILTVQDKTIANHLLENGLLGTKLSREDHYRYDVHALSPSTIISPTASIDLPQDGAQVSNSPESVLHWVYITSFEDGPRRFYIRLNNYDVYWEQIQTCMEDISRGTLPPLSNYKKYMKCIVKKLDRLYRAQLLGCDVAKKQYHVQYIDFGNKDIANFSEVYKLPEKSTTLQLQPLALVFSLYGCENLPPSSDDQFLNLTLGKTLQMEVMSQEQCKLFLEEDDILQVLLRDPSSSLVTSYIEDGTRHRVLVTHVEMPESLPWIFYVQLVDKVVEFKALSHTLQSYATKSQIMVKPYRGATFLVKHQDKLWHRGYIESSCNDFATVYFIDIGASSTSVPPSKIKYCPLRLLKQLQAQAIRCRLLHADMLEKGASQFKNMTGTGYFEMNIIEHLDDGALLVQLFDLSHDPPINLGRQLEKLGNLVHTPAAAPSMSVQPRLPSSYMARTILHSIEQVQWSRRSSDRQLLSGVPTHQPIGQGLQQRADLASQQQTFLRPVNVAQKFPLAAKNLAQPSLDPSPQDALLSKPFGFTRAEINSGPPTDLQQPVHAPPIPINVQRRFPLPSDKPKDPYLALRHSTEHEQWTRGSCVPTHQPISEGINKAEIKSGPLMGSQQHERFAPPKPMNVQHHCPLPRDTPTGPYMALQQSTEQEQWTRGPSDRQAFPSFPTRQPISEDLQQRADLTSRQQTLLRPVNVTQKFPFGAADIAQASLDPIPQDSSFALNGAELDTGLAMGFAQQDEKFASVYAPPKPMNLQHSFPLPRDTPTDPYGALQHNTEQWTRGSTHPAESDEFQDCTDQQSYREDNSMKTDNEEQNLPSGIDNLTLDPEPVVGWQKHQIKKPAVIHVPDELPTSRNVQHRLPLSQPSSKIAPVDQHRDHLQQNTRRGESRQALARFPTPQPEPETHEERDDLTSQQQTFLDGESSSKRTDDRSVTRKADDRAQKPQDKLRSKYTNLEDTNPEYFRQRMVKMDAPGLPEARSDPRLRGPKSTRLARCMETIIFDIKDSRESKKGSGKKRKPLEKMSEQRNEYQQPNRCSTKEEKHSHKNNGHLESKPQGGEVYSQAKAKVNNELLNSVQLNKDVPRQRSPIMQMPVSPGTTLSVKLMAKPQSTPSLFWAMPIEKIETFSQLQLDIERMAKDAKILHLHSINPGDACLALLSYNFTPQWHRAKVMCVEANTARVSLLDVGGWEYVEIPGAIKPLASDLTHHPALAMRCSLRGVTLPLGKDGWNPKISGDFSCDLEACKEPVLEVVAVDSKDCYSVVLRDKNHMITINEKFGATQDSLKAKTIFKKSNLHVGNAFDAAIVNFKTLGDFYINQQYRRAEYFQQMEQLKLVRDLMPMDNIQKGVIVLIKQPKAFYRAMVLETEKKGEKVKIYLLDKGGESMTVDANRLKALPEKLIEAPPFAVPVKLAHVIPKRGSDWCEDREIRMVLRPHNAFKCRIEGPPQEGRYPVTLITPEGVNMAHELIKRGLVLPMNKQGNEDYYEVYVAMIDPESMRLWVHSEFQTADLDEMQDHLQNEAIYSKMLLPPFETDAWVLARSREDNIWYRAQVKEVNQSGDIVVSYIDYGNTEVVDKVFKLPPAYQELPSFALECQLAVSITNIRESVEHSKPLLLTDELVTLRIYDQTDVTICDILTPSGESICDILVNEGFATHRLINAYVSCYLSPTEFYIQHVENENLIQEMDHLAAEYHKPLTSPQVDQMCYAKFSEDEQWYRAKVKNVMPCGTVARIEFCDYGNTSLATEFKEMAKNIQDIPALVTKCHLKKLKSSFENIETLLRDQFFDGTICYTFLFHECINDSYKVTVLKDGMNLLKLLYNTVEPMCTITRESSEESADEKQVDVIVCHYISPELFWLHHGRQDEEFARVCTLLNQLDNKKRLDQVFPDMICAARSIEDKAWYRARVDHQNLTTVFFIDTGKTGKAHQFIELTEELESIPPLAQKCCLKSLPRGDRLNTKKLETLMTSKSVFQAKFCAGSSKKLKLVTLYKDGHDILEDMSDTLKNITVTHFESVNEFYVQFPEDVAQFCKMSEMLSKSTDACIPISEIEEGMVYSAWVDFRWQRAFVISTSDLPPTVRLCDVGMIARTSEFKRIPKELETIPELAKQCYLINLPIGDHNEQLGDILKNAPTLQAEIVSQFGISKGLSIYLNETNVIELLQNNNSESDVGNSLQSDIASSALDLQAGQRDPTVWPEIPFIPASVSTALDLQADQRDTTVWPEIPLIDFEDDKNNELEQQPAHSETDSVITEPRQTFDNEVNQGSTTDETPRISLTERLQEDACSFTQSEKSVETAKQFFSKEDDASVKQVTSAQTKITPSRIPVSKSPYLQKMRQSPALAPTTAQVPKSNNEEKSVDELKKSQPLLKTNTSTSKSKVPSGSKSSVSTKPKTYKLPDMNKVSVSKNK